MLALTRELGVVHAREGIRLNALRPGPRRTELLMSLLDDGSRTESASGDTGREVNPVNESSVATARSTPVHKACRIWILAISVGL